MKLFLITFLLVVVFCSNAQSKSNLLLSKNIDESHIGWWTKDNFIIGIKIEVLEKKLNASCNSFQYAIDNYTFADSSGLAFYKDNLERYSHIADQLKNEKNDFNLQKIILYDGLYDEVKEKGNSTVIENIIKNELSAGNAIVYFKGIRIYTLQTIYEIIDTDFVSHNSCYTIYYDTIENLLYKDCSVYGW